MGRGGAILAGALTLLAVGCGSNNPASPSHPNDLVVGLRLEPPLTAVKVGTTVQFALVAVQLNGATRPVTAQSWTATPGGVAVIDGTGVLTAIRMGIVTVSAAFEDKRAAQVLSVTSEDASGPHTDLTAEWTGNARRETCDRISGVGPNPCTMGGLRTLTLNLTQAGYGLSGRLTLGNSDGSIHGWRDLFGRIFLVGTLSGASAEVGTTEITDWETAVIGPDRTMSGTFQAVERFDNFFGPNQVLRTSYRLVDVVR